MPSSKNRYSGLVVKGWRMAVVWPSPLVTDTPTPGIWERICWGCAGAVSFIEFGVRIPTDAGVSESGSGSRVAVITTSASSCGVDGCSTASTARTGIVTGIRERKEFLKFI